MRIVVYQVVDVGGIDAPLPPQVAGDTYI